VAVNCSDSVRVGLGKLSKKVEIACGESSGCIDDATNGGAIVTAKYRPQLNGEVGKCSLDKNRKDPTSGRGREDLDNAAHEENSGACGARRCGRRRSGRSSCRKDVFAHLGLLFIGHILVLGKLTFTGIGDVIGIGLVASIATAACTFTFDKLLIVFLSTLDTGRVVLHGIHNGSFALASRVIFFATASAFTGLAISASILGESGLGLARVCTNLLPAISHREEALANQQASNVLDLVNLVLSGLSGGKDDEQLLPLVCSIMAMGGRVRRVQATEGR